MFQAYAWRAWSSSITKLAMWKIQNSSSNKWMWITITLDHIQNHSGQIIRSILQTNSKINATWSWHGFKFCRIQIWGPVLFFQGKPEIRAECDDLWKFTVTLEACESVLSHNHEILVELLIFSLLLPFSPARGSMYWVLMLHFQLSHASSFLQHDWSWLSPWPLRLFASSILLVSMFSSFWASNTETLSEFRISAFVSDECQ